MPCLQDAVENACRSETGIVQSPKKNILIVGIFKVFVINIDRFCVNDILNVIIYKMTLSFSDKTANGTAYRI